MNLGDDTPVANPETRAWIENEVLAGQPFPRLAEREPAAETSRRTPRRRR